MNGSLRKLVKRHEGVSLIPYKCPAGFNAIGWGWNCDSHALPEDISGYLHEHGKITVEMAERLLDISIGVTLENCRKLYAGFDSFSENRRKALFDFVLKAGYDRILQWVRC